MRDVVELFDALDLAIARGRGVLQESLLDDLARSSQALRRRRGFVGDTLVLAISGGTGSGKSSLLNALAGEPIASVSMLRPHTDVPLAWIPRSAGPGLDALLVELGVEERVVQDRFAGLAIIDLPDMDSIVDWHRRTVEDLLPKVDAVLWIFDPEKYRDATLHEEFLAKLSDYRDQFVFVLNKVDRIAQDDRALVETHLMGVLADDGFPDVTIHAIAADPPGGAPVGIDGLADYLEDQLDAKRVATGKLVADAKSILRTLGTEAGIWEGWEIDFAPRWEKVRGAAAAGLVPGAGPAAREDALCRIEDFIAAVSVEGGGVFGTEVRAAFGPGEVDQGVAAALEAAEPAPPKKGRGRLQPSPKTEGIEAVLEERFGWPLAEFLRRRSVFGATVAYAAVGAAQIEARLDR